MVRPDVKGKRMSDPDYRLKRLRLPRDREVLQYFHDQYDREYGFERTDPDRETVVDFLERHGDLYHCLVLYDGQLPVGYIRGYERISTSSSVPAGPMATVIDVLAGMSTWT